MKDIQLAPFYQTFRENDQKHVEAYAATIRNQGTRTVIIDKELILAAGESVHYTSDSDRVIKHTFEFTFDPNGAGTQSVLFIEMKPTNTG